MMDIDKLVDIAGTESNVASRFSYSPYSSFKVGAAIVWPDGTFTHGCNVESASYGLTCCAERSAIFSAISNGKSIKEAVAIGVSCPDGNDDFIESSTPCGACRQVISELMSPDVIIIINNKHRFKIEDLLPKAFSLSHS